MPPDFDSMNETDVRESVVRPFLEKLGYHHGTEANLRTELVLRYDRHFLGHKNAKKDPVISGRADYICEVIGFGRWVVEVKAPAEALTKDIVEQAHTYAAHPEVSASFFIVTNGRSFCLYETSKLSQPVAEWSYDELDGMLMKLTNLIGPEAIKRRFKPIAFDKGKPLGPGLASKLRLIGGEVIYLEHESNHPLLDAQSMNGVHLPVLDGNVQRSDDGRIIGHLRVAQTMPLMNDLYEAIGLGDAYDFFTASEYISTSAAEPTIFQNLIRSRTKPDALIRVPGLGRIPIPFDMSYVAFTEAVGFVDDGRFCGTTQISYQMTISRVDARLKMLYPALPASGKMTGAGRFEISLADDI